MSVAPKFVASLIFMLKKRPHTPAHLFVDNAAYFITSAIHQKRPLLRAEAVKQQLLATIESCFHEKSWRLEHWVILDDHYHLLAMSDKGENISQNQRFVSTAYSNTSAL